jgi:hypothetical protein
MPDEYLSQTELGKHFGVSSHVVGRWLREIGLRTPTGKPTSRAFDEGLVAQRPSRGIGTYFYVWQSGNIGQEILDADGNVIAWTVDPWLAQVIAKLLEKADREGLLR